MPPRRNRTSARGLETGVGSEFWGAPGPLAALAVSAAPRAATSRVHDATWTIQASPNRTESDELLAVSAASASDAWAAGNYFPGAAGNRTLVEHAPSASEGAVVGATNVSGATVSWIGPEKGSTETDPSGAYQVGGLQAGVYTFTAAYPGCAPDSAQVTVLAGRTIRQDFHLGC